ncbi:two-component sensor histidine kinase [Paenibacillus sp. 79R4]|uniref:cache domain-containing sensor histidine kinase n=1 Tax=Paenibacillus sp. 79R4 TaxID=2212847 RepID=UPI0015BCC92A|nr:sensor histidine kinase [Paenibacillus sp. 79R4]NWL87914.1 two-component sensor histidine kinase [Paenibacillus sp. 79R4]
MQSWHSLKKRIHDMNFQSKIKFAFLLISMIPVIVLGSFCFSETRSLLINQSKSDLNAALNQSALTLNSQLEAYNKIVNFLSFNQEIVNAANHTYTSTFEMYDQLVNVIDQNFYTARNLNASIEQLTLYTDTNLHQHGQTVRPLSEVRTATWYPLVMQSTNILWFSDRHNIYSVRRVLNTKIKNPKDNIIYARINAKSLLEPFDSLETQGAELLIMDAAGQAVYSSEPDQVYPESLFRHPSVDEMHWNGEEYTVLHASIPTSGWEVFLYKPTSLITQSAWRIVSTVLLMIIACIVAVVVAGTLFSHKFISRIEQLRHNMKTVEEGSLEVTVHSDSKDEIGDLIRGFGNMVVKTEDLINKVYREEIARKEYEMKALQAQINPHFLYNSLSLINWRALRIHATDISEMAQLLSTFYRTTLNKGNNMILVSNEILNVQSYMKIQLLMHSNSFDVEYRIDEAILPYHMPNLMLQPLIENAIIHGIENRDEGGRIKLSGQLEDGCIVFQVEDNGIGIEPKQLASLLDSKPMGYGLKNVHDRARLMYGSEYGITITSEVNQGTHVTLRFPAADENK